MKNLLKIQLILILFLPCFLFSANILIPMDMVQTDHLKAYGVAYWAIEKNHKAEWLLNYRSGSFLIDYSSELESLMQIRGVSYEVITESEVSHIHQLIEQNNMEIVLLEKSPRVAVYVPPTNDPWDDAVRMALEYAEIPYTTLWDPEVLLGSLENYDWLHLHHEDFTGQFGKFYGSYRNEMWYKKSVALSEKTARELGYKNVPALKLAVAIKIKEYVSSGGFLFAMCSATDTYDIAMASAGVDICDVPFDGTPPDPNYASKMNYENCFAFKDFSLITDPLVYEHSDIDVKPDRRSTASRMGSGASTEEFFRLFEFSAKYDPVPTMLTQDHTNMIPDYLGQNSAYNKNYVKDHVIIMGDYPDNDVAKYIHGNFGKGTFTFLAGHDPEDYAHYISEPPPDLAMHKNSPGYRLILNNVLFPAAKKQKQKT